MKIVAFLTFISSSMVFGDIVDIAGGNHHTYTLKEGVVLSMGEDLLKPTRGEEGFVGGKLGRPIDKNVLPGKDPANLAEQARYNPAARPVTGLQGLTIVNIASGQNDGAAITDKGELYMWGPNNHGQLGLGDEKERRTATKVPLPDSMALKDIAIGSAHCLAITTDGAVLSWGLGKSGVLGHGSIESVLTPSPIVALSGKKIIAVAAGQNTHSLFLDDQGTVYTCGRNPSGILGLGLATGTILSTPVPVPAPVKFKAIGVGVQTCFGISEDGHLYGWGDGSKGHFALAKHDGSPDLRDYGTPTLIANAPGNLIQVVAGSRHVAVLDASGDVYTWGIHAILSGQLGIGTPKTNEKGELAGEYFSTPQKVELPGGAKATFLDSMANNVFLTTTDGELMGWGQTSHGRLGCKVDAVHSVKSASGKTLYLAYSPVPIPYSK